MCDLQTTPKLHNRCHRFWQWCSNSLRKVLVPTCGRKKQPARRKHSCQRRSTDGFSNEESVSESVQELIRIVPAEPRLARVIRVIIEPALKLMTKTTIDEYVWTRNPRVYNNLRHLGPLPCPSILFYWHTLLNDFSSVNNICVLENINHKGDWNGTFNSSTTLVPAISIAQEKTKTEPVPSPIFHIQPVTLEELYKGTSKTISIQVYRKCECIGQQKPKKNFVIENNTYTNTCEDCDGQGDMLQVEFKPQEGVWTYIKAECGSCSGTGDVTEQMGMQQIRHCDVCYGGRILAETENLEIVIPAGSINGHCIILKGMGHHGANIRGDVVVKVQQLPHNCFRQGPKSQDILITLGITLTEALCGFSRIVRTLDDRLLHIKTVPGEVVGQGSKKIVKGAGMPFMEEDSHQTGDLVIEFKITFPSSIPLNYISPLRNILSSV